MCRISFFSPVAWDSLYLKAEPGSLSRRGRFLVAIERVLWCSKFWHSIIREKSRRKRRTIVEPSRRCWKLIRWTRARYAVVWSRSLPGTGVAREGRVLCCLIIGVSLIRSWSWAVAVERWLLSRLLRRWCWSTVLLKWSRSRYWCCKYCWWRWWCWFWF